MRDLSCFEELDEQELDVLTELSNDLDLQAREIGGSRLLDSLEDTLSGFLRVSNRELALYGDADARVRRLFDEHVDDTVRKFITHLPKYSLRAAATKFGDLMDVEEEGYVRVPDNLKLTQGMFVAHVIGRSMEPLIHDGDACIFRAPVAGSRYGELLLIERFVGVDSPAEYTVKRYVGQGNLVESADREGAIRLEPLNPEFDAFDLTSDQFRVIAEFLEVLRTES